MCVVGGRRGDCNVGVGWVEMFSVKVSRRGGILHVAW